MGIYAILEAKYDAGCLIKYRNTKINEKRLKKSYTCDKIYFILSPPRGTEPNRTKQTI